MARAQYEFFQEHGDPELWEDHLAALKLQKPHFEILAEALRYYAERDVDPVGQTVSQVLTQARQWGMGSEKKSSWGADYTHIPNNLPMDWEIPLRLMEINREAVT